MYLLKVNGMTCGSCAKSITNALKLIDPEVIVTVNLSEKTVSVKSKKDIENVSTIITEIGFPVTESKILND